MLSMHKTKALIALLTVFSGGALAQNASPVGVWRTVDDATHQPTSLVKISVQGDGLVGVVERVLDAAGSDKRCDLCKDDRKNMPIVGMQVIRRIPAEKGTSASWDGGEILDPKSGRTYRVRLTLTDGGQSLEVRGYIGTPLFGRTQVWQRVQ